MVMPFTEREMILNRFTQGVFLHVSVRASVSVSQNRGLAGRAVWWCS